MVEAHLDQRIIKRNQLIDLRGFKSNFSPILNILKCGNIFQSLAQLNLDQLIHCLLVPLIGVISNVPLKILKIMLLLFCQSSKQLNEFES
jgi:hypothetical protein